MKVFFAGLFFPSLLFGCQFWFEEAGSCETSVAPDFFASPSRPQKEIDFYQTFSRADFFPAESVPPAAAKLPDGGGIRENIPVKYRAKFLKWKEEFLSTDLGRRQWNKYADTKDFVLTITISEKSGEGAKTDKYIWDENGKFIGATITLGSRIEKGFPDPVYYPVMNSLSPNRISVEVDGNILAATKIAHEIGHVNQTAEANRDFFELQAKLMSEYVEIFLKNGHNSGDRKLVEMEQQMGGTPIKIWEDREYWSEVNAMGFLSEKIDKENFYCDVLSGIKSNVEEYAKSYEPRFTVLSSNSCKK